MSSVTTAAIAAEIDRIQAKHDAACKADLARLKADLESQFTRVTALAAKVAKPAVVLAKIATPVAPTQKTTKRAKAKKMSKGMMRFRDPEHPERQWSGRGTNPGWYKAGIAAGRSKEYFAIPGA